MSNKTTQKKLGQYFTQSNELQKFVFDNVKNKGCVLMEPSFGAGHLLQLFKLFDNDYPMVCYEIDENVKPIIDFNEKQTIVYGDFTKQNITQKYKTIVGNPPYVKQSLGNLYIKFIELCYDYLDDNGGEMIFIVPSDFIKLTSATKIINKMVENGSFTDFLFPNDEKLFDNANIDVMVFRYEKTGVCCQTKTIVNGKEMFFNVNNGIITFSEDMKTGFAVNEMFDVYVGIVSGRDEIYRSSIGNIDVLCDKDKLEKFIFAETFPTSNETINAHLLKNKQELMSRKIKKFDERNWFEWGAPRNISSIRKYWGKQCIYIRNLTRKSEVAFVGNVQYFGGSLICLVPKVSAQVLCGNNDIKKFVDYFNTQEFQQDYIYSGRFKIGHKQISSAIISIQV